jgi:hypothetical protein
MEAPEWERMAANGGSQGIEDEEENEHEDEEDCSDL